MGAPMHKTGVIFYCSYSFHNEVLMHSPGLTKLFLKKAATDFSTNCRLFIHKYFYFTNLLTKVLSPSEALIIYTPVVRNDVLILNSLISVCSL